MSIFGTTLTGKNNSTVDASTLSSKKLVGVYFSAHWCPPCRAFTPLLADWYEEVTGADADSIEIIFATFDKQKAEFESYYAEMPWLTFGFEDPRIDEISDKHEVGGIPELVIFKPDGTLVTSDGRMDVETHGPNAIAEWLKK